MRTCIYTCYDRCLNRWKENNIEHTKEEFKLYANKKEAMFKWYKGLIHF